MADTVDGSECPNVDWRDIDRDWLYDPHRHLLKGDERGHWTVTGAHDHERHVRIFDGLDGDGLVMLSEIAGAAAMDAVENEGVTPDGDHAFGLRAFHDGVVAHYLDTRDKPDDLPVEGWLERPLRDIATQQAEINAEIEDYTRSLAQEYEDEPDYDDYWLAHPSTARALLRDDATVQWEREMDGAGSFHAYVEGGDWRRGLVELPTHQIVTKYDLRSFFGEVPGVTVTNHGLWFEYWYADAVDPVTIDSHLRTVAGQLRAMGDRVTRGGSR